MAEANRTLIPANCPDEVIEDFRNHVYYCFKYLGLGEPTPLQYGMSYRLQFGPEEFQLQAGRGAGKSVLTACYASWLLLLDPDTTILVLSATAGKATEFISMVRKICTLVPYMTHLEPRDDDKDTAFGFNVHPRKRMGQDKSCFAKGITSQITGSHADWVIADDVEIEKNSETAASRHKLLKKMGEIQQIRNPSAGGTRVLGTPQSLESIYNELPYPIFKFPAIMPDPLNIEEMDNIDDYILELTYEPGSSTQPERFPIDLLMGRLAKVGPSQFALHYKLCTSGSDMAKFPLRLADLIVMDVDPDVFPSKVVWANMDPYKDIPSFGIHGDLCYKPMKISDDYVPYVETVMFIDPSGRGADETAVLIASFANGYIIIHELVGFALGYDTGTLTKIAKMAVQYKIKHVRYESNMGDAMFGELLKPIFKEYVGPCGIVDYRVTGAKERRMLNALEPVFAQHRMVFSTKAIKSKDTQVQITRLQDRRGCLAHDDRVDVLHAAAKYWEQYMGIAVDEIIKRNAEKSRQDEIDSWQDDARRFSEYIVGRHTSGASVVRKQDSIGHVPRRKTNTLTSRRTWDRR